MERHRALRFSHWHWPLPFFVRVLSPGQKLMNCDTTMARSNEIEYHYLSAAVRDRWYHEWLLRGAAVHCGTGHTSCGNILRSYSSGGTETRPLLIGYLCTRWGARPAHSVIWVGMVGCNFNFMNFNDFWVKFHVRVLGIVSVKSR